MHAVHVHTVSFSPLVLIKCSICSCHQHQTPMCALRVNGSRKRSTSYCATKSIFRHGSATWFSLVAQRWWRSVARGEESAIGDRRVPRTDSRICQCVVKAGGESSAENEFSGPGDLPDDGCWKCCLLYADTQEEHRSDDDDGASRLSNSTRTPHHSSSNCFTSSDVRGSAGNRPPCHSPSSERRSHRSEWPWSSEGVL